MQTIERPETPYARSGEVTTLQRRIRRRNWIAGLLALAVIGLATWVVVDVLTADEGARLPGEAEAALENYGDAWRNLDTDAFANATTPDYEFVNNGESFTLAEQLGVMRRISSFDFDMHERTATGEGPYYVAQRETVTISGSSYDGISTVVVEQHQGEWKVALHTWIGQS